MTLASAFKPKLPMVKMPRVKVPAPKLPRPPKFGIKPPMTIKGMVRADKRKPKMMMTDMSWQ